MLTIRACKFCLGLVQLPLCYGKAADTRHEHMPLMSCWLATTKLSSLGGRAAACRTSWVYNCWQTQIHRNLQSAGGCALFKGFSRLTNKASPAGQGPRPLPSSCVALMLRTGPCICASLLCGSCGDAILLRGCCITDVVVLPVLRQSCDSTGPVLTPVLTPALAQSWHSRVPVVPSSDPSTGPVLTPVLTPVLAPVLAQY